MFCRSRLVFSVEDTGCGIKDADLKKIFEDFRQLDSKRSRSVEGTGLGLSITRHLVELMDGSVYVKGTRFDIIFMDHMMPGMDGIEAAQHIRSECGENGTLPVIIALTANAMEGVRETFFANGFQDFLTKPIDRRTLHMTLQKWIPVEKQIKCGGWFDSLQSSISNQSKFQHIIIEGINTDEVAAHSSASVEEFNELLDLYCLDGKRKLEVLQDLWEEKDYKAYGIEVHALKSASANVGAMQISNLAREQENAVKREDYTFVDSHAQKLLGEYEEQLSHIQKYLDAQQKESKKKKDKEMPQADLLEEIRTALDNLENFKSKDCAHKIEELLEYRMETYIEEELEKIQEQLKLYEDDAAEQMLRELIEQMQKEA